MTTHKYSSFNEIDQHLKVLKLRREITGEHFKLNMHRFKNAFHPLQLLSGFSGYIQIGVLSFLSNKILKKLLKKRD